MKLYKTLIVCALALAFASAANAQTTYFRFTGSTAYRSPASLAVCALLSQNSNTFTWGYNAATGSGTGANAQIWSGTINGIGAVIIKSAWSGSEGGIQTVDQNGTGLAIDWLGDDNILNFNNTGNAMALGGSDGSLGSGDTTLYDPTKNPTGTPPAAVTKFGGVGTYTAGEKVIPDACMSDTFQGTSAFQGSYKSSTYPALQESSNSPIGVVPFVWCGTHGFPSSGANMTDQMAVLQYKTGTVPLSFYTGNVAQSGTTVYATGRNPDSGTRATAFIDTGIGVLTVPMQYQPLVSGSLITGTASNQTMTSIGIWPKDTVNGVAYNFFGQSGYSSGGQLAGGISSSAPSGDMMVAYLGVPDAINAVKAGAVQMTYNGAGLNFNIGGTNIVDYTPIYNGQYTFWGYEHLYYRQATVGTSQQTIADGIALQEKSQAIVPLSNMTVGRVGYDGGALTNGKAY